MFGTVAKQQSEGGETLIDSLTSNAALGFAFGIGQKMKTSKNSIPKRHTSWQARMRQARVNLSNRDHAHLKEVAKNSLYDEDDAREKDGVSFEARQAKIIEDVKSKLSLLHLDDDSRTRNDGPMISPILKNPPKKKKKKKKKGKQKKPASTGEKDGENHATKGKAKGKKSEKGSGGEGAAVDVLGTSAGGVAAGTSQDDTPNTDKQEGAQASLGEPQDSSAAKRDRLCNPDAIFGPDDLTDLSNVEKNTIFKFSVEKYVCDHALPRLTKPYADDDDDDDDPYGKKKQAGWDISQSIFGGRCDAMESKDYLDCGKNKRMRVHNRACVADIRNGDLKDLFLKLKVGDGDECLDVIKENFVLICDVFKAYSTKVDVPNSLTLNTFTEFALGEIDAANLRCDGLAHPSLILI